MVTLDRKGVYTPTYGSYVWELCMGVMYGSYVWELCMGVMYGSYVWECICVPNATYG